MLERIENIRAQQNEKVDISIEYKHYSLDILSFLSFVELYSLNSRVCIWWHFQEAFGSLYRKGRSTCRRIPSRKCRSVVNLAHALDLRR